MSVETVVLGMASVVLPRHHRARWREEAAAVLMEVSGFRRLWYTVDTVLKVPVLARQHRRGQMAGVPRRGRTTSAVVGAALLASAVAILSGAPRVVPGGAMWDPVTYVVVLGGLVSLVVARSFRSARRGGGPLRYADSVTLLVAVFAGAGPLIARPLAIGLNLPVVALAGNVLPGLWLAVICALALRRGTGPRVLAAIGTVAGLALIGVLGSLPLERAVPGLERVALLVGQVSVAVAVPTFLIWSAWAGVRLLLGRQDLLTAGEAP